MILLNINLALANFMTMKLWCFDSAQMSLKPSAIDGGIIQKKVDLYARDVRN